MIERTCLECNKMFSTYESYVKKGRGKFCSISCGTRWRNKHNNPAKDPAARQKISINHADVSGINNPMYGKRGIDAPTYKGPINLPPGSPRPKDIWRSRALRMKKPICEACGIKPIGRRLHIHHKDGNRSNNQLNNLMVVCVVCHNTVIHKRPRDTNGCFAKDVS